MARSKSRSALRSGRSRRAGVSLPSMCIGLLGSELKSNWMGLNRMSQLRPTAGLGRAAVVVVGELGELGGALA